MTDADARIAALEARVAALEARLAERPRRSGAFESVRRLGGFLLSPARALRGLRAAAGHARLTSSRAVWSEAQGRWVQRLPPGRFARKLATEAATRLFGAGPALYAVRPKASGPPVERPRVLHVIANSFVGGSTQLVVDLLERLGHRYEMETLTSALPRTGRHEGMILHRVGQPADPAAMDAVMRRFAPALVHVHYWGEDDTPWYAAAFEAAARAGAPVLQNVNTPVPPFAHPSIRRTVYVSDYVRRTFGRGGADEAVVHPGIDAAAFAPRPFAERAGDTIGMVYRLDPDKLSLDSLSLLVDVARLRPRTRVIVVGDGPLLGPLHARTVAAGVRANFEFLGAVPYARLPEIYARFRVFVAPVRQESFGQVVPFAMSMGLAVAGYDVGALPEILGGRETLGATREEAAAKIAALLDDPARVEALGAANRERARAFDVAAMCAAYDRLYQEILGREVDAMPGFPPAEVFAA